MTISNPGAIADVSTSGPIAVDWGNAVRDRLVNNFATAAARDAAITSPVVGQMCVIDNLTTVTLGLQQYVGATDTWVAPWNLPWGVMPGGYAQAVADQGSISAAVDLASLTTTITYLANRRIKISGYTNLQVSTSAALTVSISDATPTTITTAGAVVTVASLSQVVLVQVVFVPGALTSKVYKLRASVSAGTATLKASSTSPAFILIEDIGPSGAPA